MMRVAAIVVGLVVASAPALAKDYSHVRKPVQHRAEASSAADPTAMPKGFSTDAVGWRLIEDPITGARLGLPEKLVPRTDVSSRGGSRWTSAQGQIQVETFRFAEASLSALFDEEKKAARRQIESSDLKNDSFVVRGVQGLKNFVVRADTRGGEVRGITILYDQATEGTMESISAAMATAFAGFPDPKAEALPGIRRAVEYATAIVVGSDGDLIAPAHVTDDCQTISVPPLGHAERVAVDKTSDLALLRLYGARNLVAAPLADGTASVKGDLTLTGIADPLAQAGGAEVSSAKVRLTAQGLEPAPALGFAGAAAIGAGGALVGMVNLKSSIVATGGNSLNQAATLVPAETIRTFLQAHDVVLPATGTPEHRAIEQSTVRVVCVRK